MPTMPDNLKLNVKVQVDSRGFKAQLDAVKKALKELRAALSEAGDAADEAGQEIDGMGRDLGKIDGSGIVDLGGGAVDAGKKVKGLNSNLGALARRLAAVAAGYFGFRAVQGLGRQIDAYTELNNRIRLVANTEIELATIREKLFAISQTTRTSIGANAQLYSRLAQASARLGFAQSDLLKVTEILNKQVLIGGNNASEAAAGLVQFAQGIASGKLQGDELRSVLENLLGVQQGLIDGFEILYERGELGIQITTENLRDLAAEGVLTPKLILGALLAVADRTEERFEQVTLTIGGALTNIVTAWQNRFGDASGTGGVVANFFQDIADLLNPETEPEALRRRLSQNLIEPAALSISQMTSVTRLLNDELRELAQIEADPNSLLDALIARRKIRGVEGVLEELETAKRARQAAKDLSTEFNRGGEVSKPSERLAALVESLRPGRELLEEQFGADIDVFRKRGEEIQRAIAELEEKIARLPDLARLPAVSALAVAREEEALLAARQELTEMTGALLVVEGRRREQHEADLAALPEAVAAERERLARARADARQRAGNLRQARQITAGVERASRELERVFETRARATNRALDSLERQQARLLEPFERERRELRKWGEDTLAVLKKSGAAYDAYADKVREAVNAGLADIAGRELEEQQRRVEELIRTSTAGAHGLLRGLEGYAREALDFADSLEYGVLRAFTNIEDELVRLLTRGRFSLKRFLRDLAADAARAVVRVGITGPVAAALGGRLRGALGLPAPAGAADVVKELQDLTAKQDDVISAGEATKEEVAKVVEQTRPMASELQKQTALLSRIADCACRQHADLNQFRGGADGGGLLRQVFGSLLSNGGLPNFHDGGRVPGRRGREVLGVLQGGEFVVPLGARIGGGPQQVQVVLENRGQNEQEIVEQRAEADGERLVINVATEDVSRRGPLSRALENTYSLRRRTA